MLAFPDQGVDRVAVKDRPEGGIFQAVSDRTDRVGSARVDVVTHAGVFFPEAYRIAHLRIEIAFVIQVQV